MEGAEGDREKGTGRGKKAERQPGDRKCMLGGKAGGRCERGTGIVALRRQVRNQKYGT